MKTFLKIVAAIIGLFIIVAVALNLYFTDERLKSTVVPYMNEAVGREVEVESMSLTFFSTFPRPGISVGHLRIPGETQSDTLASLDQLVASVELFSLLGDQISISEIQLQNPSFTYKVYADSSTNIDFLLQPDSTETDTSAGYGINIPYFQITNGNFGYQDETSGTSVSLRDLNANLSLAYAKTITSTVDLKLGGLSATVGNQSYVKGLPLSLQQKSTLDLDKEQLNLDEGTFSIRGLALNLSGTISQWSTTPKADILFTSSTDNFGELLRLVPQEYASYTEGLESRGSLSIDGQLSGALGGDDLPGFSATIQVSNGYLKNPDLPKPIEGIQLSAQASNELLSVDNLSAQAGENKISGSGTLQKPLEEDGDFLLDINADVNLATLNQFYDIAQFDLESLNGQLTLDAKANGNRNTPDKAAFSGVAKLTNGSLKMVKVPKAIKNISIDAQGNQDAITINNMQLQAASNTFSLKGNINQPLKEEQRTVDLTTDLKFDLATIKDFYPINEDTLAMRGILTANARLQGRADQIERAVQQGSISLQNGYLEHKSLGKPIDNITLESTLDGPTMAITKASIKTGDNSVSASGSITNYLSDDRTIDLKLTGDAMLSQITSYYDLQPTIKELTGKADLNFRAIGPLGDPANMKFNGQLTVQNAAMEGEGLVQPVSELNGKLELSPQSVDLNSLKFKIGSSDIALQGSLQDYMAYLKAEKDRKTTPKLSGSYKSELLNLDELINWEDTTSSPVPINLPDLNSSVQADISKMIVTGVTMKNLKASASTTPKQIKLEKATVNLFEGQANGSFIWDVPQPDRTKITFNGSLDSLRAKSFFAEYPILGKKSKFHEYISGSFSARVDYESELNVYLEPLIETSKMDGNFGMSKSRLQGHPLQQKLATWLKTKEFNNVVLDEWKSTYSLKKSIFTINNLRLTSGDIGAEMNGTQHLVKGDINYQMRLLLPGRFKNTVASVITKQAAEALTQKNGTLMVPLRITGTHENPKIALDKEVIGPIVKDYLKNKAGNVLNKLIGN